MGDLSVIGLYQEAALHLYEAWYWHVRVEGGPEIGIHIKEDGNLLHLSFSIPVVAFPKTVFEQIQSICNTRYTGVHVPAYNTAKTSFDTVWNVHLPILRGYLGKYMKSFILTPRERVLFAHEDKYTNIVLGLEKQGYFYMSSFDATVRANVDTYLDPIIAALPPTEPLVTSFTYPIVG